MRLRVRYFASIRELTGVKEEQLEVPEGTTAAAIKNRIQSLHEGLRPQEGNILVAVNGFFVEPSHILRQGDEIAFFPPVSGG